MFRHILLITLRNLRTNRLFSVINIAGLAIGLAGFILITTVVRSELDYDTFHANAERIYRPVEIQRPPGVDEQHVAVTMGPLAPAMAADFPEVEAATRINPVGTVYCRNGETAFYETGAVVADSNVFQVFTIPLLEGDPATALARPDAVVLSPEVAGKYFPDGNAIGQTMTVEAWYGNLEVVVTGIMAPYPDNSHLSFRMMLAYQAFEERLTWVRGWHSNTLATYVLLREGSDPADLDAKFPDFITRHIDAQDWNANLEMYLQPLLDIHLHSNHIRFQTFNHNQGSIAYVTTFSLVALVLLLIACINFMNLSTARSTRRAREVGIRKTLGSHRGLLIGQFLGESILLAAIALLIAVGILAVFTPFFESWLGDRFYRGFTEYPTMILELVAIVLFTGLIAGSYPALFLSRHRPVDTLKGRAGKPGGNRSLGMRRGLVILQFCIALVLIIQTGVVVNQMRYIDQVDLGYSQESVLYMRLRGKDQHDIRELIKTEIARHPGVLSVAAASGTRGASGSQSTRTAIGVDGEPVSIMMRISSVDYDFLETMGIELVAGRFFSRDHPTDTSRAVVINETAVRELGWENPVGREFGGEHEPRRTVIGVVKDFHYAKLTTKIEPMMMTLDGSRQDVILARLHPDNLPGTIAYVEETWSGLFPDRPLVSGFLDDEYARSYEPERATGQLLGAFAFLAVFVACLGLFGLAAYTTEQKTKEIGIRKAVGATATDIVMLLSRQFQIWVLIAAVPAIPLAVWLARDWLNQFQYRADLSWIVFALGFLLVFAVAFGTVGFQAWKAARTNPVKALRYE